MIQDNPISLTDCARLGETLGIGRPVPEDVFLAVVHDPEYARDLFTCRGAAPFLDFLLSNPPAIAQPTAEDGSEHTTVELMAHATKSFWEWTTSGFRIVDDATYDKRMNACNACPYLIDPPGTAVYSLVGARSKICKRCGCVVSKKAKLPHESCPAAHPDLPGMTKWGELAPGQG